MMVNSIYFETSNLNGTVVNCQHFNFLLQNYIIFSFISLNNVSNNANFRSLHHFYK